MEEIKLPLHWNIFKLGKICIKRKTRNPSAKPDKIFTYVDVSSICNKSFKIIETKKILGKDAPSRARQIIYNNDVIFATVRPTLKRIALVPLELHDQICSTGFCVLRANPEYLDSNYLYFYLLTNKINQRVESLQKGATYPAINDLDLFEQEIYLPPLLEQKAIAHTLRTIQKAKETRQRELELERERKAALMQYLFTYGINYKFQALQKTRFGQVPQHWKILPLEKCAFIQTGTAKGRKIKSDETVTLPYLRVANVQDGYLDLSEIKEIIISKSEIERYSLRVDDVVLTEGGDPDKLGRGFIWRGEIPNCIHQNHIFAVRTDREIILPEYLAYLVQSNYGKAYFLSVAHRTTNLASINSTKLKAFPTIVPELGEQKNIIAILQMCDRKIQALEKEISLIDELFHATLEQLMTGEISTQPLTEVQV